MLASKVFYAALAAGIAFIIIGVASSIYTNTAVDVSLDYIVGPGISDIITPDMNVGNTASIMVTGSRFNVTIKDPDGQVIRSESNVTSFSHNLTAQKGWRIHNRDREHGQLRSHGHRARPDKGKSARAYRRTNAHDNRRNSGWPGTPV